MQAVTADFSGYTGEVRCIFRKRIFKQRMSIHLIQSKLSVALWLVRFSD
jgi:hypothetical protein